MIQDGTDYWLGGLDADRDKGLQWMSGATISQFSSQNASIQCLITDLTIFIFIPFLSHSLFQSPIHFCSVLQSIHRAILQPTLYSVLKCLLDPILLQIISSLLALLLPSISRALLYSPLIDANYPLIFASRLHKVAREKRVFFCDFDNFYCFCCHWPGPASIFTPPRCAWVLIGVRGTQAPGCVARNRDLFAKSKK